jgi:hypothetical protein
MLPTCALFLFLHASGRRVLPLWARLYCCIEIVFAVYYYDLARRAQALKTPVRRNPELVRTLFTQSLRFGLPIEHAGPLSPGMETKVEAVTTFRSVNSLSLNPNS